MPGTVKPVYINGKFYAAGLNGVHRVADNLIRELDERLTSQGAPWPCTLFVPVERKWEPALKTIRLVEQKQGHSAKWEQFDLPRLARDGVLVNLCNLAPVMHRCKLTMIHDAQFRFSGNSYGLPRRLWYNTMIPLSARTSRRVLTVSQYSKDMLDLLGICPAGKIGVLYNGTDHLGHLSRVGAEGGPDSAEPFVLLFGSTKLYKNVEVVFRAFEDPRLSGIELVVVGQTAEDFARSGFAVPPRARFVGRVDDAAILALYRTAIATVFPSRTEGFGLPPAEAMSCGCPAIVSPAGAIPEVCRDAVLYADVDSPETWAEAILTLQSDEQLRTRKIVEGRERAAAFTWVAAGMKLVDEIGQLAGIDL